MNLIRTSGERTLSEYSAAWESAPVVLDAEDIKSSQVKSEIDNSGSRDRDRTNWDFKKVFDEVIRAMGRMMEVRDPYTAGHQGRVSRISVEIAQAMQLTSHQIKGIQLAALIHDIGKLAIPSEILSKPGRLSESEFDMIKTHSTVGFEIVRNIEFPWPIAKIVLQHHERMNGSGYPDRLVGDEILLETRVLSVADVIEAMSSNRPYRAALGAELALEEIEKNKGILYDTDVVDACLTHFRLRGFSI